MDIEKSSPKRTSPEKPETVGGQSIDNVILKKLLQMQSPKQQESFPNLQQLSIEVNLRRSVQSQNFNAEAQSNFKDKFLKNFKVGSESINDFAYKMIYQLLISRSDQRMSPCEVLQLLTELRDRIFENQKQLEQCIQVFRQKIKSYEYEIQPTSSQDALNKMIEQKQENEEAYESQSKSPVVKNQM